MQSPLERLAALEGRLDELESEFGKFIVSMRDSGTTTEQLYSARVLLEKTLKQACQQHGIQTPKRPSIEQLKTELARHEPLDDRIRLYVEVVQRLGNIVSHAARDGVEVNTADVEVVLPALLEILSWYQEQAERAGPQGRWRDIARREDLRDSDRARGHARVVAEGPGGPPPLWVLRTLGLDYGPDDALPLLERALERVGTRGVNHRAVEIRRERCAGYELRGSDGKAIAVLHGVGGHYGRVYVVELGIGWYYRRHAGGPLGWLGFPISNEFRNAEGARSDFEHGYIQWFEDGNLVRVFDVTAGHPELRDEHAF